jgi:hypothetical protein
MKKLIFLFIFFYCFLYHSSFSLPSNVNWKNGFMILKNHETLKGEITYNLQNDLVQIKIGDKIKTFTPFNVQYFQVYDESQQRNRFFTAIDANMEEKSRKGRKTFLEVLVKGEIIILQKEEVKSMPVYNILTSDISFTPAVEYSNFVYCKDNIVEIKKFKRDVLPLMKDEEAKILKYIDSRNMDLNNFEHQLLIIDYYNYIKDPSRPTLEDQRITARK